MTVKTMFEKYEPWMWFTLGGFSLAVALMGALYAPWPWWLTIVQGLVASGCFWLGLETDPKLSGGVLNENV
jgi:hypothetical protein